MYLRKNLLRAERLMGSHLLDSGTLIKLNGRMSARVMRSAPVSE
jgi:hypothetical protein